MDRLATLRALARESLAAADRLVWGETGLNREKSRLLMQADEAISRIARIEGVEPGDVQL